MKSYLTEEQTREIINSYTTQPLFTLTTEEVKVIQKTYKGIDSYNSFNLFNENDDIIIENLLTRIKQWQDKTKL